MSEHTLALICLGTLVFVAALCCGVAAGFYATTREQEDDDMGSIGQDGEMIDGQHVYFKLAGDQQEYRGIVIKARKMWVEREDGFIADETNITEWRPA